MKILIAVDGSKASLDAVKLLVEHADWYSDKPQVELVTVHLPVPKVGGMARIGKAQLDSYYQEEGEQCLAAARKMLERAGIAYEATVLVGPVAETIVKQAKKAGSDLIYIGTRGMTSMSAALMGSTASKILQISDVPVLLVK